MIDTYFTAPNINNIKKNRVNIIGANEITKESLLGHGPVCDELLIKKKRPQTGGKISLSKSWETLTSAHI
jgi:hypothetical protein